MTDTTTTITPNLTFGAVTLTASAALFSADDVGRLIALKDEAPARVAAGVYGAGALMYSDDRGVRRLYRVIQGGTVAVANMAGTTPNYDQNVPTGETNDVRDGTAILKYLGRGRSAWGWGVITAFTSTTQVTASVAAQTSFANTNATYHWRLGEWGGSRGWPRSVCFFQGRTVWGGSLAKPQTVWTSETGDFESMSPCEPDGAVLDTNAITETIDDDQVNTVRWLVATHRGVVVGSPYSTFLMGPASQTNLTMTPGNVQAKRQARIGSSEEIAGIPVENVVLFAQRGKRKLREFAYDFGSDSYKSDDLSILAEHVTGTGIVEAAYQEQPDGILWAVREDGYLLSLTYDRDQEVRAWCRHQLAGGAVVESVCTVPGPDGSSDDVYVAVKRVINGVTHRWVEVIRSSYRQAIDGDSGAFCVDAGLSYSGTPANVVSGLTHLEGQTVAIYADGAQRSYQTVVGGSVSIGLPAASTIHVGLDYTSRADTLNVEAGAGGGTAQGKPKRIHEVIVRMNETGGVAIGRDGANVERIDFRTPFDAMTQAVPLFSGDKRWTFPVGWDRRGRISVMSVGPMPLTCLAVIEELQTNG